jgi:hypothetical protein
VAAHIAAEAPTGNAANLRANHLDCAHERVGKQERPSQGVDGCPSQQVGADESQSETRVRDSGTRPAKGRRQRRPLSLSAMEDPRRRRFPAVFGAAD